MFNSGVRLVGREVGPWGGWPPDQAAAHATLAPDQNPPVQLVQPFKCSQTSRRHSMERSAAEAVAFKYEEPYSAYASLFRE